MVPPTVTEVPPNFAVKVLEAAKPEPDKVTVEPNTPLEELVTETEGVMVKVAVPELPPAS